MKDPVNRPEHYVVPGLPECITVIEGLNLPYHLGAAVKYLWRAGRKTPDALTDLRKAAWYINRYIALLEDDRQCSLSF